MTDRPAESGSAPADAAVAAGTEAGEPRPPGTGLRIRLDVFEGPLDLLLYLIRKEQVNIYDIPIARITEYYLETLKVMQELNLDVAGEFLVMAATLLQVKSQMLLPRPPELESEDDAGSDPRAERVRTLLEYERYRTAAHELAERPWLGRDEFVRSAASPDDAATAVRSAAPVTASLFDLVTAFRDLVERLGVARVHRVLLEPVSIRQRIVELLDRLPVGEAVPFDRLLTPEDVAGKEPERIRLELVVTFLAVLELVRVQVVRAVQERLFGPILVERAVHDLATIPGLQERLAQVEEPD